MLCSGWIRPEDLVLYHKLGINRFKLDGRGVEQNTMLEVIEHYMKQEFDGNFFDLMFGGRLTRHYMSAYLSNKKLNNFIFNIAKNNIDCRFCGGRNQKCIRIANQITFNEQKRKEILQGCKNESYNMFDTNKIN
jgi:hypothetical protein